VNAADLQPSGATDTPVLRSGRSHWHRAVLIAIAVFCVYLANGREVPSGDAITARFAAIQIARSGTTQMDDVIAARPWLRSSSRIVPDRTGHWRPGSPIASALPAAAVAWVGARLGVIDLDAPGSISVVAKLAASLVTAVAVACCVLAAWPGAGLAGATWIAIAFGIGTNLWACASQTLWQHDVVAACLMGALALVAAGRLTPLRVGAASLLLGLACAARPWVAPEAGMLVAGLACVSAGASRWWAIVPASIVGGVVVGLNLYWFGHPLGASAFFESLHPALHATPSALSHEPWVGAAGLLVSPNRGLFVFSPVVLFALPGLVSGLRAGRRSLSWWITLACLVQCAAYACYAPWWGGHTYGPRYLLDVLPLLVPGAAATFAAIFASRVCRALGVVALAWSIYVAAVGAFIHPFGQWNMHPVNVDLHHERLWDVHRTQIGQCARELWVRQKYWTLQGLAAVRNWH
jgi:hypothetical protein